MTEDTYPVELIKAEVYFVKFEGADLSDKQILESELSMALDGGGQSISVHVGECKAVTIDWHDEIDINMRDATSEQYEKYFKSHTKKNVI